MEQERMVFDEETEVMIAEIISELQEGRHVFLTGCAGTGKTTIAQEIIARVGKMYEEIVPIAPTHKALGVLVDKLGMEGKTLSSFLTESVALDLDATDKKRITSVRNGSEVAVVEDRLLLIIDELSMIKFFQYAKLKTMKLPALFLGDPYQLLPVDSETMTIPKDCLNLELSTIHRQKGGFEKEFVGGLVKEIKEVGYQKMDVDKWINQLPLASKTEIASVEAGDVFLNWTNSSAERWGNYLKQVRPELIDGKHFCTIEQYRAVTLKGRLSDQADVQVSGKHKFIEKSDLGHLAGQLKKCLSKSEYDLLKFGVFDDKGSEKVFIYIQGQGTFNSFKQNLHKTLVQFNKEAEATIEARGEVRERFEDEGGKRRLESLCAVIERSNSWDDTKLNIYKATRVACAIFNKYIIGIDYVYSLTIHKAQGSTFRNVYVGVNDLKKTLYHGKIDTFWRLFYVAITRASGRIYRTK